MAGSATITAVGQALTTLAITTAEDTYTFNYPSLANPNVRTFVQLTADQNWLYSHVTGGPFYPVGAGVPFDFGPLFHGKVIYVKAATTSGTLSLVVKDGPIPSLRTNS